MTSPSKPSVSKSLYWIWGNMNNRCRNQNNPRYGDYGGRGITVCKRWRGRGGYEHFAADMGPRPSKKHTLDRINNDKGYSPSNCKWSTREEQNRNTRHNRILTFNGKTQCITAWAEELDIPSDRIYKRLIRGWTTEHILTRPVEYCYLTFKGRKQLLTDWAAELGMTPQCLRCRLQTGWSIRRAFTTRPRQRS